MRDKVFIIAEAGVNHNGSLAVAERMVKVAAAAGADAIKFQTFVPEALVTRHAGLAGYQKDAYQGKMTQLKMLQKLRLDLPAHKKLIRCCQRRGIIFLSTPFDEASLGMLRDLGLAMIKIPSGEITNRRLLHLAGSLRKKIILSTGMADTLEIARALSVLMAAGTPKSAITVMHSHSEYPTEFRDANLRAVHTIRQRFGIRVGYSDHTLGFEAAIAAVALGAEVIEKHFTLDKSLPGPDQKASITPSELGQMVRAIRNIEVALGTGIKRPSPREMRNRKSVRKSIVAAIAICKGEKFTKDNLALKRPGSGLDPFQLNRVIGRRAKRYYPPDALIRL